MIVDINHATILKAMLAEGLEMETLVVFLDDAEKQITDLFAALKAAKEEAK